VLLPPAAGSARKHEIRLTNRIA